MSALTTYASANAGLAGLLFFFLFFVAIGLWLVRPGAKEQAIESAQIPLKEDKE